MPNDWTLEQRKEHLKGKFYTHKLRLVISAICLLLFVLLLSFTMYFYSHGEWLWLFIFLVVTVVSAVIMIFVIDMIYFGAE